MNLLAFAPWQYLLNGLGWCLAQIYSVVPNYAAAIVILTVLIRLVLLPFGFKQIKSMQHMQALQPELKQLQKKYKNNKQKLQEEQMKLYREAGVNPLGGCLPLLLTLPFLFAMYAVIRPPLLAPVPADATPTSYQVVNDHLPQDSQLFLNVLNHQDLNLAGINLQCSLATSGTQAVLKDTKGQPLPAGKPILGTNGQPVEGAVTQSTLDCGAKKFPDAIPYVLLLAVMLLSAVFMQRQMTKANPQSAQAGPQAALMKYMPLIYVVWGWAFPAGLILYWTTANGIQIAQQTVMLRAGHIGPDALERAKAEQRRRAEEGGPKKKGFMTWMNEKAQAAQGKQEEVKEPRPGQDGRNDGKGGPRKPPPQQKGQQKKTQQKKPRPTQQPKKPQQASGGGKPIDPAHGDSSPNGTGGKPAKGAQPGNQLRPKKKPSGAPEGLSEGVEEDR